MLLERINLEKFENDSKGNGIEWYQMCDLLEVILEAFNCTVFLRTCTFEVIFWNQNVSWFSTKWSLLGQKVCERSRSWHCKKYQNNFERSSRWSSPPDETYLPTFRFTWGYWASGSGNKGGSIVFFAYLKYTIFFGISVIQNLFHCFYFIAFI